MRYTGLIEKYRDRLPVGPETRVISLGEGNTPLIRLDNIPRQIGKEVEIYVKYEGLNPTGLFKDRGMTMAVTKAVESGTRAIICERSCGATACAPIARRVEVCVSAIQRVAGMQDVLPADRAYWDTVIAAAEQTARLYAFQRLDVPIIEYTDLFERGVGAASDFFVQKEMYTIEEEDGDSITLRPEFTAGVVRAYVENGLANETQPVKLYTFGPIFRRERPQAGRFRQHSQFNCEIVGETDPAADAEVISLALDYLRRLGLRGLSVQLNSTGCRQCKPAYVEKLRAYLEGRPEQLSPVDQERLRRNPLRVLDSKEPGMDAVLAGAPHIADHLCEDCADHYASLRQILDRLGVDYRQNFRLVRGIDYYVQTVFEVWAEGIGAQAALFGGGRYDGLSEAIGGPPAPAVGFGSGVERVILAMQAQGIEAPHPPAPEVMIVHFGGETKLAALELAQELRAGGISTFFAFARERRSMKSQMREADRRQVRYTLIMGEDEVAQGLVTVRPMDGGEQTVAPRGQIVTWLQLRAEDRR